MADALDELPVLDVDPDDHADALEFLDRAALRVIGRFAGSSNATLAVEATLGSTTGLAVYKPQAGERPLADFRSGTLHRREVAAYRLSQAIGDRLVPPTVLREDAPFGEGSLQAFIRHDPERTAFTIFEADPASLAPVIVFDIVANNADRKGGHVIVGPGERLWAIDNGLTFHVEPKLRTVLWPFAGTPIEAPLLDGLRALDARAAGLDSLLGALLDPDEIAALEARIAALLAEPVYPDEPTDRYPYPWPPI